jgi:pilus assembly protein CpaE
MPKIKAKTVKGQLIAMLAARGGVGCTSLAVNLGCTLAKMPGNEAILVDLNLVTGDADVALDLSPIHRLTELVLNIEQVDIPYLQQALCKHSTGLSLLARPEQLQDSELVHEDSIQRILTLAQINCTHLLVDLSKGWTPIDRLAVRMADVILLVFQLELSSLRNAALMLHSISAEEEVSRRIRLVANRVGAQMAGEGITLKKATEVLGRPIYWQIPNDSKAMLGAWNRGVPLSVEAPKSAAQQAITELARDLSGVPTQQAAPQGGHTKSSSIFSMIRGH